MSGPPDGGVYLFCLTPLEDGSPGPDLAGFGAEPIEAIPLLSLALWIQPLRDPPVRSRATVLTHHRVVEAAWRTADAVSPMRFGQWFQERDAMEGAVAPKVDALAAGLERVRGAGEHGVRIVERAPRPESAREADADAPEPAPQRRGRAHLVALAGRERRRREREARGRAVAGELADGLGGRVRDERVQPLDEDGLVSVAHLVAREDEAAYVRAVDAFARDRPSLRIVRGGPWPPYSFVS